MNKDTKKKLIALTGQPNSGKSTIFNNLTGARQFVANYPGITIEKRMGRYNFEGQKCDVIDLPGTYSLTSYTDEEKVARNFLLEKNPDVVINVVDASNVERHLYLTFQLREMGLPLMICLNMMDVAKRRGFEIDVDKLSNKLGAVIIPTIGIKGKGKNELKQAISSIANKSKSVDSGIKINYGKKMEPILTSIEKSLSDDKGLEAIFTCRWLAVKLMENDSEAENLIKKYSTNSEIILKKVIHERENFLKKFDEHPEHVIATQRHLEAKKVIDGCIKYKKSRDSKTLTDKIDTIVCNRIGGPILLIVTLFLFYNIVMGLGGYLAVPWKQILDIIRNFIDSFFPAKTLIADGIFRSVIINSAINGIFALFSYIPMFFLLFILVGILEDSGYMARVAFILDRLLRSFGLHGQSALPMILGGVMMGGCSIPGVMATRGMKDQRAKLVTILIMPLMHCGAKIPFYIMITSIFFKNWQGTVLFFFSFITFIIAVLVAKFLDKFIVKGEHAPFLLELPSYHMPTPFNVIGKAFHRLWSFIKKMVIVVAPITIIIWFFISFPGLDKEGKNFYFQKITNVKETFIKNIGEDNSYVDYFDEDKEIMEFQKYNQSYKKAKKRISNKKNRALDGLEKKFIKIDNVFFETMINDEAENIQNVNKYNEFVNDYEKYKAEIDNKIKKLMNNFNKKYLNKNPEFFKVACKGKFYIEENMAKNFEDYLDRYYTEWNETETEKEEIIVDQKFKNESPSFFKIVRVGDIEINGTKIIDNETRKILNYFQKEIKEANDIKRNLKNKTMLGSCLGVFGKILEPVSMLANFDWRVNIAFISTFAAKENFVATINSIFDFQEDEDGNLTNVTWTALDGICLMFFLALFPPCLPTLILVRTESRKTRWMLFATVYPIILGFVISVLIFQVGSLILKLL